MPRTSPRERAECGSCSESFFESSMVECQGGPCLNRGRLVCKPCYNGGSGNVCPQCKDAPACDCCVGKESVRFSCAAGHKNTELVCDTCCKESECCGERYCTACTKQFKKGRCPECAKADDSQLEGLVLGILTQEGQIGDERQELLVRYVAEETARVRAEEFRARFERMHNIILPIVVVLVGFLAMHTTGIGLTWEKCTKMYRTLSK